MKGRGGLIGAVVIIVGLVVAILSLSGGDAIPFDVDSTAPDGYRALSLLLRDAGLQVTSATSAEVAAHPPGPGDAVVVPVPSFAEDSEKERIRDAAAAGATVLWGPEEFYAIDSRTLTRTPALPVPRGFCDIAELESLREIDVIAGVSPEVTTGLSSCFGSGGVAEIVQDVEGVGRNIHVSSPYLWVNSRLQPDKEDGGRALDNAAVAVGLLGNARTVTFVEAVPAPGVTPDGTQGLLALMPFGVKLALAQCVGAFLIYAWWRSRRLGRPVREVVPVEVAGSELVEAVGGLLRRAGSSQRAAEVVRSDLRRTLGSRLGLPPEAGSAALVQAVAARTGRSTEDVGAVLVSGTVTDVQHLIVLTQQLDSIRTEVLDGQLT